jgi:hypothetical protein
MAEREQILKEAEAKAALIVKSAVIDDGSFLSEAVRKISGLEQ